MYAVWCVYIGILCACTQDVIVIDDYDITVEHKDRQSHPGRDIRTNHKYVCTVPCSPVCLVTLSIYLVPLCTMLLGRCSLMRHLSCSFVHMRVLLVQYNPVRLLSVPNCYMRRIQPNLGLLQCDIHVHLPHTRSCSCIRS